MVDFLDNDLGLLLKRTKKISEEKAWQKSFNAKLKKTILDWIRIDQLWEQGIDEDGDIIGLYSEWTEMMNPEKVAGTPFTLKDTGEFYKSLFIEVLSDYFVVDGDGIKIDENGKKTDLFKWLGEGIIGLTEENKEKLAEELKIKYVEYVRKLLQID